MIYFPIQKTTRQGGAHVRFPFRRLVLAPFVLFRVLAPSPHAPFPSFMFSNFAFNFIQHIHPLSLNSVPSHSPLLRILVQVNPSFSHSLSLSLVLFLCYCAMHLTFLILFVFRHSFFPCSCCLLSLFFVLSFSVGSFLVHTLSPHLKSTCLAEREQPALEFCVLKLWSLINQ